MTGDLKWREWTKFGYVMTCHKKDEVRTITRDERLINMSKINFLC